MTGGSGAKAKRLTIEDYTAAIVPALRKLGLRILLEPGRFLVGNAGVLLTRVRYIKANRAKEICDRRRRYERSDSARALSKLSRNCSRPVAGECDSRNDRCCRTSLRKRRFFCAGPRHASLAEGDLVAIMSAGAYGFVMASNYNSRPLPAEVLVRGDTFSLIRERQSLADLVRGECDTPL